MGDKGLSRGSLKVERIPEREMLLDFGQPCLGPSLPGRHHIVFDPIHRGLAFGAHLRCVWWTLHREVGKGVDQLEEAAIG